MAQSGTEKTDTAEKGKTEGQNQKQQQQNSSTMLVENSLSRSFPSNPDPDTKSNSISKSKKSSKKSSSISAQFSYCPSGKGFAANGTVVLEGGGVPVYLEKETPKSPALKPPPPQITTTVPFTAFVSQKPPSFFFQAPTSPTNVPKKRSSKRARSPRRSAGTPKASPNANTNAKAGGTPVGAFVRSPATKAKAKVICSPRQSKFPTRNVNVQKQQQQNQQQSHYGLSANLDHKIPTFQTPNLQQQQFSSPVALEESAAAPLLVNPVIRVSRFSVRFLEGDFSAAVLYD